LTLLALEQCHDPRRYLVLAHTPSIAATGATVITRPREALVMPPTIVLVHGRLS
jgi:hypothetical protein